jgi:hypothetical protein
VPTLDDVTAQCLLESVGSFQRGLLFDAAVLCGAAAERELLLLLTAIELWDPDGRWCPGGDSLGFVVPFAGVAKAA